MIARSRGQQQLQGRLLLHFIGSSMLAASAAGAERAGAAEAAEKAEAGVVVAAETRADSSPALASIRMHWTQIGSRASPSAEAAQCRVATGQRHSSEGWVLWRGSWP